MFAKPRAMPVSKCDVTQQSSPSVAITPDATTSDSTDFEGYRYSRSPLQRRSEHSLTAMPTTYPHTASAQSELPAKTNKMGLPDKLKSGIENLSGMSLDEVRVHYNSSKPVQMHALAYAQGADIHVAPGQEQHLPHEAWHVVQQAQGRVHPTVQVHGTAINDNQQLEREADEMGARANHVTKQMTPVLQANGLNTALPSQPIMQRMLVIGGTEFSDPETIREHAFDALGATAFSVENLVSLGIDPEVVVKFDDWDKATARYDFANDHDPLALAHDNDDLTDEIERSGLPKTIVNSVLFRTQMSPQKSLAEQVFDWAQTEAFSLASEVSNKGLLKSIQTDFYRLKEVCDNLIRAGSSADPIALRDPAIAFQVTITKAYHAVFTLQNRETPFEDGKQTRAIYGYHVTKLSNIPSIRASGLQPRFGASDRGSVAMSTSAQKEGSIKTSANMVAFAKAPSTFRPYINQYEDRRQMVEGAPLAFKPIMLRFHIDQAIGKENVLEGLDFMDGNALNTDRTVLPEFIEVLTPDGWIAIQSYDTRTALVELRSGNNNARVDAKWTGDAVLLTGEEIAKMGIFEELPKLFSVDAGEAIQFLEGERDKQVYNKSGVKLTFRGASMQTSGNPKNWDYVFTVVANEFPGWLGKARGRYVKEIGDPSEKQLREFDEQRDR